MNKGFFFFLTPCYFSSCLYKEYLWLLISDLTCEQCKHAIYQCLYRTQKAQSGSLLCSRVSTLPALNALQSGWAILITALVERSSLCAAFFSRHGRKHANLDQPLNVNVSPAETESCEVWRTGCKRGQSSCLLSDHRTRWKNNTFLCSHWPTIHFHHLNS